MRLLSSQVTVESLVLLRHVFGWARSDKGWRGIQRLQGRSMSRPLADSLKDAMTAKRYQGGRRSVGAGIKGEFVSRPLANSLKSAKHAKRDESKAKPKQEFTPARQPYSRRGGTAKRG
jgi:hypothetical protein